MESKGLEKRVCRRFKVPGATLSYRLKETASEAKKEEETEKWDEEFCPVLNLSCGGIKFRCKKPLMINSKILVRVSVPGEKTPLALKGEVRWLSTEENREDCQVGVQFSPYGEKEFQNYPGLMVKLLALEQKYSSPEEPDIGKYEIDS